MTFSDPQPFKALIVGGGVAGLEAALALRDLAGEHVNTTLLAAQPEFVYRPMRVREPFSYSPARRYPLDEIARDIGVDLFRDAFSRLDPAEQVVYTEGGEPLSYDALLLALGANRQAAFRHAITLDDSRIDEQLHGLIQDIEGGYVDRLAFLVPTPMAWPLPIYELALMTARRAYDMNINISITIATPEDAPLAIFGSTVSERVTNLLAEHRIRAITSAHCGTPSPGEVSIHPGSRTLHADRVVALPQLSGPSTPGLPKSEHAGFIQIDAHCKVIGIDNVYAAGDATAFAVKHGGIAAQQADTAAESIAAVAGASIEPRRFVPEIHAVLLGAEKPLYLSAHITGGHGSSSEVSDTPSWSPPGKIVAKHLSPYLESRDRTAVR